VRGDYEYEIKLVKGIDIGENEGAPGHGDGARVGWRVGCGRHVCHPRTEVVAVATTTTATCRWVGGVHGRGVGSVLGNRQQGSSSSFSGGPSSGGTFVTYAPKLSPSLPPLPPLVGGQVVRAVKGSDRCWGTDGRGRLCLFQGA
jgi:hypothetical protein